LTKIDQKRSLAFLTIGFLILLWSNNFYLLHKKNTPQLKIIHHSPLVQVEDSNFAKDFFLLTDDEVKLKLKDYQELDNDGVKNLGLDLNLIQLGTVLEDKSLTQEYFDLAQTIAPWLARN
jgi:hypothetical protein